MTHTLLAPKPLNNLSDTRLPSLTTWLESWSGKVASKHFKHQAHPVMASFEPGERWAWCYIDQMALEVPKLVTPDLQQ